jgi:hypothetical protein
MVATILAYIQTFENKALNEKGGDDRGKGGNIFVRVEFCMYLKISEIKN